MPRWWPTVECYLQSFAEYQARNDLNQERRMQAINAGLSMVSQAATQHASAGLGLAELSTPMSAVFLAFDKTDEETLAH